jgi:hypothetical protein
MAHKAERYQPPRFVFPTHGAERRRLTPRQFIDRITPTAQFCGDNAQEFANRGVSNAIHLVMSTMVASRDPSSFAGATERAASSSLHRSAPAAEPTNFTLRKRSFIQQTGELIWPCPEGFASSGAARLCG